MCSHQGFLRSIQLKDIAGKKVSKHFTGAAHHPVEEDIAWEVF
jgi:hypothetical protein